MILAFYYPRPAFTRGRESNWTVRNGVKSSSLVELALIEHAHVGTTFRASFVHRTVATCHGYIIVYKCNFIYFGLCMFLICGNVVILYVGTTASG